MTALRFQTGGRHQTSLASLRGPIKVSKLEESLYSATSLNNWQHCPSSPRVTRTTSLITDQAWCESSVVDWAQSTDYLTLITGTKVEYPCRPGERKGGWGRKERKKERNLKEAAGSQLTQLWHSMMSCSSTPVSRLRWKRNSTLKAKSAMHFETKSFQTKFSVSSFYFDLLPLLEKAWPLGQNGSW